MKKKSNLPKKEHAKCYFKVVQRKVRVAENIIRVCHRELQRGSLNGQEFGIEEIMMNTLLMKSLLMGAYRKDISFRDYCTEIGVPAHKILNVERGYSTSFSRKEIQKIIIGTSV